MKKNNLIKMLLTSVLILLPIIFGLVMWNSLPEQMPIHWNAKGEADSFASRPIAILLLPCILLVLHWISVTVTMADNKKHSQSKKVMEMLYYMVPVISLLCNTALYSAALGIELEIVSVATALVGIILIVFGNYMPKIRPNRTFGLRIKQTLESEANWNATHRFSGRLFVISGFAVLMCILLPTAYEMTAMFIILTAAVLSSIIYSFRFSRMEKLRNKK